MDLRVTGKRIFVTGGAGFIGTRLCSRLVDDNEIVIFDNGHLKRLRYTELEAHKNVTFVKGDVLDYNVIRESMKGCNMVVHLAAIAGVDDVFNHPVLTMKVNLLGTYHVLEAARELGGIERLIDFSTSEVFGSYAFRVQEADVTSLGAVGKAAGHTRSASLPPNISRTTTTKNSDSRPAPSGRSTSSDRNRSARARSTDSLFVRFAARISLCTTMEARSVRGAMWMTSSMASFSRCSSRKQLARRSTSAIPGASLRSTILRRRSFASLNPLRRSASKSLIAPTSSSASPAS